MSDLNSNFCLYVIVNLEFSSMGAGRCAAQASHAANQFTDTFIIQPLMGNKLPLPDAMEWRKQANGFGTQIVKAAKTRYELIDLVKEMKELGFHSDLVIDPEYYLQDGRSFHIIKDVITAAFVFGSKEQLQPRLYNLPLLLNTEFNFDEQFNVT